VGENVVRIPDYQNRKFKLWRTDNLIEQGITATHLRLRDRFSMPRYQAGRVVFSSFVHQIERYLRRHPDMQFDYPRNRARAFIYLLPGIRSWSLFMPGGFATHPVHNPDIKRLHSGKRIDYLTRNLFRHSLDAVGLRSRSYAMSWYAVTATAHITKRPVRWLSVAAGTGYPTFEAAELLRQQPRITLSDINEEALTVARHLAEERGIGESVTFELADATKKGEFARLITQSRPDVIDMMGLVEYLADDVIVMLMRTFYAKAPHGATLIFTNMRPTHPHLQTHQRGLGWPGVQVRTIASVAKLLHKAAIPEESIEVLLPDDQVYGIYCIKKP